MLKEHPGHPVVVKLFFRFGDISYNFFCPKVKNFGANTLQCIVHHNHLVALQGLEVHFKVNFYLNLGTFRPYDF